MSSNLIAWLFGVLIIVATNSLGESEVDTDLPEEMQSLPDIMDGLDIIDDMSSRDQISACETLKVVFQRIIDGEYTAAAELFAEKAVSRSQDSDRGFLVRLRGKQRITFFLEQYMPLVKKFGGLDIEVRELLDDQPNRCLSIMSFKNDLLSSCPRVTNGEMLVQVEIGTENAQIRRYIETLDSAQGEAVQECMMSYVINSLPSFGGSE